MPPSSLPTLRVTTTPLGDDRPLVELLPDDHGTVWLREGRGLVGWGVAHRVAVGVGPSRLRGVEDELAELWDRAEVDDRVGVPGGGCVAMVSVTFDDQTPGSRVVVPRRVVGRDGSRTWLTTIDVVGEQTDDLPDPGTAVHDGGRPDRVRFAGSSQPDVHYLEAVAAATDEMLAGPLEKVVLARDHAVWSREAFALRPLVARLAARFPSCFTFAVEGLVGATPELLVRREGDAVTSVALAGTAARDDDPELDAKLLDELRTSDKMQREHDAAAASVVASLTPLTTDLERHDVEVLRLANVQHLQTRVTGRLAASATVLELAAALHPTAAVGGTPRDLAVDAIRRLEGMDRGRYGAPVGWVAADGDGELGIALRCAELSGARARLFAGAGIVAGSLPEDELLETRLKLRAMQEALA